MVYRQGKRQRQWESERGEVERERDMKRETDRKMGKEERERGESVRERGKIREII